MIAANNLFVDLARLRVYRLRLPIARCERNSSSSSSPEPGLPSIRIAYDAYVSTVSTHHVQVFIAAQ